MKVERKRNGGAFRRERMGKSVRRVKKAKYLEGKNEAVLGGEKIRKCLEGVFRGEQMRQC